jgi:hypothetical protein
MADAPIRITTAGRSRQADLARRQRRYLISMGVRVLCFIGAVVAGAAGINWLWPILVGGALILPYIAVVMANANDSRIDDLPLTGGGELPPQVGPHGG